MPALKFSRQREAIRSFLLTRKDHPTADVVYENVRQEYPNISLGTVYRNLSLLSGLGQINRITTGDGKDHFDAFVHPHDHFVCRCCNSVIDIEGQAGSSIERTVGKRFEGKIDGHTTLFFGLCPSCIKSQKIQ